MSGGNQRKLVTALAMLGNPAVIYLDESSAGVDPYSRRMLWKTIRDESKDSALIVTTHSMEEAEALGTKMAIMVDGKFKCFGTGQEIKEKYGTGFSVQIKLDLEKVDEKNTNFLETISEEIKELKSIRQVQSIEQIKKMLVRWFQLDQEYKKTALDDSQDFEVGLLFHNEFSPYGLLSSFYRMTE